MNDIITHVETVASITSAGAALYAVWQAGSWRRSDEWRALQTSVDGVKSSQALLEQRMEVVEGDVDKLPTAADIAEVKGAITRVESEVKSAGAGVDRIEELLMRHALANGARI